MVRALYLLLMLPPLLLAQTPPAEPTPTGLVLRFDVDLVQMDAQVIGRDGRRVTGLKAEDFEVLQDGKPQTITHFSHVTGAAAREYQPERAGLERAQVQRTIAVVVDDIFLEFGDFANVRQALTRFLDEEVRPGDLVSVMYASRGSGALRQFTTDTRLLHRAVDRMYWRPPTAVETAFPEVGFLNDLREVILELGTFPGRKALVLIAPGMRVQVPDVRRLADLANRASVTVYGVDARGLPAIPPDSGWDAASSNPNPRRPAVDTQGGWSRYRRSQETISTLAESTGGLFLHDSNATFDQLREAAEDAGSYYLIGWYPGESAFRRERNHETAYHRVQIRMRDKSLRVRTREGYFGRTGTQGPRQVLSVQQQMRGALISPFRSGDLDVRLTADFQRQEAAGSFVSSLLHIAPKGVRFEPDGEGCWKARLEIARALWPVDLGAPQNDRVYEQILDLRTCGQTGERVRQEGFVATVEDRVPSPGSYQVRVAVRNVNAEDDFAFRRALVKREDTRPARAEIGSAVQFLVIPDLKRTPLAISGVTLSTGDAPRPAAGDVAYRPASVGDPAVRRFRVGEEVRYDCRVFGAANDIRLRLLRGGKEIAAASVPAGAGGAVNGTLPLSGIEPGDYVLGIIASGAAAKGKLQRAEQWVDFQIR